MTYKSSHIVCEVNLQTQITYSGYNIHAGNCKHNRQKRTWIWKDHVDRNLMTQSLMRHTACKRCQAHKELHDEVNLKGL